MTVPSQAQLHAEVDRLFREAHPAAPHQLDPHDPEHAELVQTWEETALRLAGEWANAEFVRRFPDAGFLDEHSEFFPYWLDIRDQILHDTPPQYQWDSTIEISVETREPTALEIVEFTEQQAAVQQAYSHGMQEASNLALLILDHQDSVLDEWTTALHLFHTGLGMPDAADLDVDWVDTAWNFIQEKVVEELLGSKYMEAAFGDTGPGMVFDALKAANEALEKAAKARSDAKVGAFYQANLNLISSHREKLVASKKPFVDAIEDLCKQAAADPYDEDLQADYHAMQRHLVDLERELVSQVGTAKEQFGLVLAAGWIQQDTTAVGGGLQIATDAHAVIDFEWDSGGVRLRKVKLVGSKAEQVVARLRQDFPNGIDLYALPIERHLTWRETGGDGIVSRVFLNASGSLSGQQTDFFDWQRLYNALDRLPDGWARTTDIITED